MTTTDRPYFVPNLFQRRYMELLALAEDANAAFVLVNTSDWYVLTQCTAGSAKVARSEKGWPSLTIAGRVFAHKPSSKPPSGTLDLTGAEPSFEP